MLTAETITDEQIYELQSSTDRSDERVHDTYLTALNAPVGSLRRVTARARCAEILNQRNGGSNAR